MLPLDIDVGRVMAHTFGGRHASAKGIVGKPVCVTRGSIGWVFVDGKCAAVALVGR